MKNIYGDLIKKTKKKQEPKKLKQEESYEEKENTSHSFLNMTLNHYTLSHIVRQKGNFSPTLSREWLPHGNPQLDLLVWRRQACKNCCPAFLWIMSESWLSGRQGILWLCPARLMTCAMAWCFPGNFHLFHGFKTLPLFLSLRFHLFFLILTFFF